MAVRCSLGDFEDCAADGVAFDSWCESVWKKIFLKKDFENDCLDVSTSVGEMWKEMLERILDE